MAAIQYPPYNTPSTPAGDYTASPWTAPNGTKWLYDATKTRWTAYAAGGAADVADLTTDGLTTANMLRVASGGGLEERTPAQVLSDIGAVSDTAYNATSWNGVTTIAPSKNAVRDLFEDLDASLVFGITEGTYAEGVNLSAAVISTVSPNTSEPGSASLNDGTPLATDLIWSGVDPQNPSGNPIIWSTDGTDVIPVTGDFWICENTGTAWKWTHYPNGTTDGSASIYTSTTLTEWPEDAAYNSGGVATRSDTVLPGAFPGQWCKSTTAWWQWNGTAWIKTNNLDGTIAYDGTASGLSATNIKAAIDEVVAETADRTLSNLSSLSAARTNLGAGTTGDALFTASTVSDANTALGIVRVSRLADDTVSTTTKVALTGMSFSLAASTWYKLELAYRYTTTSTSGLRYWLVTTGTFATEGASPGALGAMSNNASVSTPFQSTTTEIALRSGSTAADNQRGFAVCYFKTNASGTGTIQIALLSGSATGTSHEVVAVLSPF